MTERRIETAKRTAVSYRNYRRARERALTRLAKAYPDQYVQYLEEEKANDETQGRKWLDINGTTSGVDTRSSAPTDTKADTSNQRENQGNDGGEA